MDSNYYSDKVIESFLKGQICNGSEKSLKYYESGDILQFRKSISNRTDKSVKQLVLTFVTDALRDITLETVGYLTKKTSMFGDAIVTGGEAFNNYLSLDNRVVTSDIDLKFVPSLPVDKRFFEKLQVLKLYLWDLFGKTAARIEPLIVHRLRTLISTSVFCKMYGVSLGKTGPYVRRRYTLIKKKVPDVLIDVELFTLDLKIRYFTPEVQKIEEHNLGGILDLALMRPYEFGYEVINSRSRGIIYMKPLTGKVIYNKDILVAGKKFLVEDLYLMQKLDLRPKKKAKDRQRMYMFAKKVLELNVTKKMSEDEIFRIVEESGKLHATPKSHTMRPKLTQAFMDTIVKRVNPQLYRSRTTTPKLDKVLKEQLVGTQKPRTNFVVTNSHYVFDLKKHIWVPSQNKYYVKNVMKYRPVKTPTTFPTTTVLYGYNKNRNTHMSKELIKKSSQIPLVGLKNTLDT
jgi:hypothetical protein